VRRRPIIVREDYSTRPFCSRDSPGHGSQPSPETRKKTEALQNAIRGVEICQTLGSSGLALAQSVLAEGEK
jgi:hypothetical protein